MTFPLMSRLGAKCVYRSTVRDSEEHKHGAAIQSDLIETRQSQRRRFFSTAAHLSEKAALSLLDGSPVSPINQTIAAHFPLISVGNADQSKLCGGTYVRLYY